MPVASTLALAPSVIAVAFAMVAAWVDYKQQRIPNRLVLVGCGVALGTQLALHGWGGGGSALAGFALGLALMVPFYLIGGMGAGDAKLMAMVGMGLGPLGVLSAAVLTFIIGGVLALALAVSHGTLGRMLANVRTMLFGAFATAVIERRAGIPAPAVSAGRLPYGIAIALGTVTHVVLAEIGIRIF
jgi:prepilin peptidase CpaA